MDERREKELRKQYKEREQAEARRTLGLFPDQLRDLRAHLERSLGGLGIPCDHTLSRTRDWAAREELDPDRVAAAVSAIGGCCDCEVLLNVTPDQFGSDRLGHRPGEE